MSYAWHGTHGQMHTYTSDVHEAVHTYTHTHTYTYNRQMSQKPMHIKEKHK